MDGCLRQVGALEQATGLRSVFLNDLNVASLTHLGLSLHLPRGRLAVTVVVDHAAATA